MDRLREAAEIDIDNRLTDGQLHSLIVDEIGTEPLVKATALIMLGLDHRSKAKIDVDAAIRYLIQIHVLMYGQADVKARKKPASEEQFQLDFAWSSDAGSYTVESNEGADNAA